MRTIRCVCVHGKWIAFNVFGAASIWQSLPKCKWHPIRSAPSLTHRRRIGCRQLTRCRKSLIANTFWSSLISILWFLMHAIPFTCCYSRAPLIGYMYVCPSHTRLSSCPVCRFFFISDQHTEEDKWNKTYSSRCSMLVTFFSDFGWWNLWLDFFFWLVSTFSGHNHWYGKHKYPRQHDNDNSDDNTLIMFGS